MVPNVHKSFKSKLLPTRNKDFFDKNSPTSKTIAVTFKISAIQSKMTWACDPALTSTIVNSYQALPALAQTLQAIMAAHCALVGDHLWPDDAVQAVIDGKLHFLFNNWAMHLIFK